MDEGATNTFFSSRSAYNDAKLTFEGQGYVCENKHKNAQKKWEDVPIIVTSNSLPYILTPAAGTSDKIADVMDYKAFMTRIKFHKLDTSYRRTDKFPYTP